MNVVLFVSCFSKFRKPTNKEDYLFVFGVFDTLPLLIGTNKPAHGRGSEPPSHGHGGGGGSCY